MTDPAVEDVEASVNWETYELVPPQIHLQRIRTHADLEAALARFQVSQGNNGGFHYMKQDYRNTFEYATTGNAKIKDNDIYAYSYHSEYGNSTSTREHYVIGIGGGIAMNLHTRQAVLISQLGDRELTARDVPADMFNPVLRRKV